MKISACSIAKNEEKNAKEWFENIKSCDDYYVLDTGSRDNTIQILKSFGVIVKEKNITPFDFSRARNSALDIINNPDWLLMIDFDERLPENWRKIAENIIKNNPNVTAINFFQGKDKDYDLKPKLFKKDCYKWQHSIHEVLVPIKEDVRFTSEMLVTHIENRSKEKDDYYQSMVLREIDKDRSNFWFIWFSVQYYLKYGPEEKLIEALKLYVEATEQKFIDLRFICLCNLIMRLPYEEATHYVFKLMSEFVSQETIDFLIKWGMQSDKPEFILFLTTLLDKHQYKKLRTSSIERILQKI